MSLTPGALHRFEPEFRRATSASLDSVPDALPTYRE